jgi:hypothetical protein
VGDPAQSAATKTVNPVNPVPQNPTQTFSLDYVKDLREEIAKYRTRATQVEKDFKTAESELQRLKSEVETNRLRWAASQAATKVADVDVALSLLDKTKIQYDEAGNVANLDDLLKDLIAAKPFLAGVQTPSPTNPTNPPREGAKFTREQIAKMTPDEINANWDEVQAVLAGK